MIDCGNGIALSKAVRSVLQRRSSIAKGAKMPLASPRPWGTRPQDTYHGQAFGIKFNRLELFQHLQRLMTAISKSSG